MPCATCYRQGIGNEELSEATIGYAVPAHGELFKRLFETPYFYIQLVPDIAGAEMAGTLKNIVALGAGFIDGFSMGPNTKVCSPPLPSTLLATCLLCSPLHGLHVHPPPCTPYTEAHSPMGGVVEACHACRRL
jgi:hypothetical protein